MSVEEFRKQFPNHPYVTGSSEPGGKRKPQARRKSRRRTSNNSKSYLEGVLGQHILALKLPAPQEEYAFHDERKWRFDFAWPDMMLAVEVEGGTLSRGRHVRPIGFQNDCEKYNAASSLGWTVLRYTAQDVNSGRAIEQIEHIIKNIIQKSNSQDEKLYPV